MVGYSKHFISRWLNWHLVCLLGLTFVLQLGVASNLGSLRFDNLGPEQGFSPQSLIAVTQDKQGLMWFGTQAGLIRFDGYRTTTFRNDPRDPTSISDNFISAFYEDNEGRFWIGTQSSLSLYDKVTEQFTNFIRTGLNTTKTGNYKVFTIVSDGKQGLWLATDYGLMHFDIATRGFTDYRHTKTDPDSLRDDLLNDLVKDRQGNLWIATPTGLDKFTPDTKKFEHINTDLQQRDRPGQNSIVALSLSLQTSNEDTLWIASDTGLASLKLSDTNAVVTAEGSAEAFDISRIQTLYHGQDGKLWIGTVNSGLLSYDIRSKIYERFRHRPLDRNSLAHNHVSKIFQDQTGVLWVGAKSTGLSRVDLASGGFDRYVQLQDDASGTTDNRIRAIAGAGKEHLWLGTYAGGLLKLNIKSRQVEVWEKDSKKKDGLQENQIAHLLNEKEGRVWVGTRSGLTLFDPKKNTFTAVPFGTDVSDNYIEKTYIDSAGVMWVSSRGGLHRKLPGQAGFKTFRHNAKDPDSITNNWAMALLEDRQGVFWIGTMNGLDRYDRSNPTDPTKEKFIHLKHDEADSTSISHNRVHCMYEDRLGTIWVGTSGGLNRVERRHDGAIQFRFFPTQTDGTAESVGGILEDKEGNIWISSTAGISRLDVRTGKFKNYTVKDGMIQGSYLIGAAFMSEDGTMNFGGWTGLTRFKPENIRDNTIPPKLIISDFLISNESITKLRLNGKPRLTKAIYETKDIYLAHTDSIFAIEFAALHYADPMENSYAYRLESFEDKWVYTDAKKRFATYTNLDPGDYVFHVKASNKNGVWNEEGVRLTIHIAPPYWKTWWFRTLTLLLLFGIAYAFFFFRMRELVQQKIILAEQVASRTQELERQKASVENQKDNVEQAHKNISLLSEIGKKITAKLDNESIVHLLYQNVNELMDATVFGVGFYVAEKQIIDYPYVMEDAKRYDHYTRDFKDKNQLAVWCIENEKEVYINDLDKEYASYIDNLSLTSSEESLGTLEDGTVCVAPQSLLYVPIFVRSKIRGVISVHSYQKNAYHQTDLDVLRTLASYVGIALENADAYHQLQGAQEQLVEREKLAALGALVAGVAHELNTPLGNSLLIASSIEDNIEKIAEKIESGSVKRSDFNLFRVRCLEACVLLMRSLKTSANLVSSFKQVAVDQASAQGRVFLLFKTTSEIVATMMNQVRHADHVLTIDIPNDIQMQSYPGPYGQVIINLIQNAMVHAFEGRKHGQMRISAHLLNASTVRIEFSDDGGGIQNENIGHIFEPFFTTKLGQGGSGLGLNVTYNIVTSLLEGQISVESVIGKGTTFTLDLPLRVNSYKL